MSSFHICLSAAKNLSSFHLLPVSLITDHLQITFEHCTVQFVSSLESIGSSTDGQSGFSFS